MKKLIKILPVVMVVCIVLTSVFAGGTGILLPSEEAVGGGDSAGSIGTFDSAANRVWNTVINVVRILAIAAVVFAGLRYMFASADQKADIKKSMGILAIGAVLVFGATTLLGFITRVTNQVIKNN